MKGLLDKIDSKVINSAGGILLAGFLVYGFLKIFTNDLAHINTSIANQNVIMAQVKDAFERNTQAFEGNAKALEKNTDILKELQVRIR